GLSGENGDCGGASAAADVHDENAAAGMRHFCGGNGNSAAESGVRNVSGRKDGFSYAYQYPGMNKVQQAAGRVIRTAEDCGVIGLLDERFLRRDYRALFPREWEDYRACSLQTLPGMLDDFWGGLRPRASAEEA
ncbi:MAG: hypothetical protein LIO75_08015, partial [Lachnospiraceae bacterium]|nr:hypothetical protein [Lachnospiraceae bacterium]